MLKQALRCGLVLALMSTGACSFTAGGKTYEWLGAQRMVKSSQSTFTYNQRFGWGLDGECHLSVNRNQHMSRNYDSQSGDLIKNEYRTRNFSESCRRTNREYRY